MEAAKSVFIIGQKYFLGKLVIIMGDKVPWILWIKPFVFYGGNIRKVMLLLVLLKMEYFFKYSQL